MGLSCHISSLENVLFVIVTENKMPTLERSGRVSPTSENKMLICLMNLRRHVANVLIYYVLKLRAVSA